MTAIYLDANAIISALESPRPEAREMSRLLIRPDPRHELFTSDLTMAEVCVKPYERALIARATGDQASGEREGRRLVAYERLIFLSHIQQFFVERVILRNAAMVRAQQKSLKLPDAIHIASARYVRCQLFVTDDQRLHKSRLIDMPFQFVSLDQLSAALS